MQKMFLISLIISCAFFLTACNQVKHSQTHKMSTSNSERLEKLKEQYNDEVKKAEGVTYHYSEEDNVLKINLY